MSIYSQELLNISENKYIKIYLSICNRAQNRANTRMKAKKLFEYAERHHILPKAFKLGGEKDKLNFAYLTAREHFICHKLLVFGLRGTHYYYLSLKAINQFRRCGEGQNRTISSRDYAFLKKCSSIAMTGINNPMFNRRGANHPNFGKTMTAEQCTNIGNASRGRKWSPEAKALRAKLTKDRWSDPIYKERVSASRRGKTQTPEHIAKRIATGLETKRINNLKRDSVSVDEF